VRELDFIGLRARRCRAVEQERDAIDQLGFSLIFSHYRIFKSTEFIFSCSAARDEDKLEKLTQIDTAQARLATSDTLTGHSACC